MKAVGFKGFVCVVARSLRIAADIVLPNDELEPQNTWYDNFRCLRNYAHARRDAPRIDRAGQPCAKFCTRCGKSDDDCSDFGGNGGSVHAPVVNVYRWRWSGFSCE